MVGLRWPNRERFCKALKEFRDTLADECDIDFVISERDTNQRARPKEPVNRQKLWQDKEKFIVDKTGTWSCPDDSHPLFTIKLTKEKPVASCYYCSKTWIYREDAEFINAELEKNT